ncbi:unnamed protein product (macronuclear) [Paramecium tetraurelia]|uniref:Uncharacterized protein n=1 Tax=Paramecium tetraurelia TaxID=5888 RepID=A0CI79_PARTE|nr:uncharacterized protein GSPATT00007631001 [Paramecium tetraurelia]CAK70496.1 unnamed protein product [Paramecium tetraurelia]|eukprot:XP_001437893.1 hypothetical protein (macronuclear) [Paramecium tetraurelia strain d4-2]
MYTLYLRCRNTEHQSTLFVKHFLLIQNQIENHFKNITCLICKLILDKIVLIYILQGKQTISNLIQINNSVTIPSQKLKESFERFILHKFRIILVKYWQFKQFQMSIFGCQIAIQNKQLQPIEFALQKQNIEKNIYQQGAYSDYLGRNHINYVEQMKILTSHLKHPFLQKNLL